MSKKTTLEIFTTKPKLAAGKQQTVDVLVRITPPEIDKSEAKRPKLNLSVVLDRSGSMEGNKMLQAREAAKYCIDQLLPSDRLSTVIFDDIVEILFPSQLVESKESLKKQIDSVTARNSTALHEAWVRGGLEVSKELNGEAINRVLLITDGLANVGETNTDRIVTQAQQLAAKGVSTSTIGIGGDFNENLLMPMAEAAGGNAWHVENAEDMTKIFSVELKGLLGQIGHTVTLGVKTNSDVTIADVLNDFERDESGRYKLPNLQMGSQLDILIQLRVPAREAGEKLNLAEIGLTYIEQESRLPETIKNSVEIAFDSAEAIAALPENAEVIKTVQMLMNARARKEAIDKMDRHDYAGAAQVLQAAKVSSQVFCAQMPAAAAAFSQEATELEELEESMKDRSQDKMSRKRMIYAAFNRVRGK